MPNQTKLISGLSFHACPVSKVHSLSDSEANERTDLWSLCSWIKVARSHESIINHDHEPNWYSCSWDRSTLLWFLVLEGNSGCVPTWSTSLDTIEAQPPAMKLSTGLARDTEVCVCASDRGEGSFVILETQFQVLTTLLRRSDREQLGGRSGIWTN